jgi:MFS family permease
MPAAGPRLITRPFVVVTGAAFAYFCALGAVAPVLPIYVEDVLGGSGVAVGLTVGVFAVSAALLRPLAGRIGDSHGRGVLVVGGSVVFGLSVLAYGLVESVPWLLAMRLISGVGEAAVFVGAATTAQDLAPPHRRGEAASYFSVAIYGGIGVAPIIGEAVQRSHGTTAVWVLAAGLAFVGAVLGAFIPKVAAAQDGPPSAPQTRLQRVFHPAALGPGCIMLLATSGLVAFTAFMPRYALDLGLDGSGRVFLLYSALVLMVRILGARLPDRLGATKSASAALVLQTIGFVLMGLWAASTGLYASTAVYALGVSLMYPSLMPLVIAAAPDAERSQAVGTFTLFFDLAQGFGGILFGVVVAVGGTRWAFPVAGLLCAIALGVLRYGPIGRGEPVATQAYDEGDLDPVDQCPPLID